MASSKDIMLRYNLEYVPTYSTVHEIFTSHKNGGQAQPSLGRLSSPSNGPESPRIYKADLDCDCVQEITGIVISCITQAPNELEHATYNCACCILFQKFPLHFVLGAAPRTAHTSLKLPLKAIHPE